MPAEVVKKRGRPEKAISDPIEIDVLELKKSTTRAKSTKSSPKQAKTTPGASKKGPTTPTASNPAMKSSTATNSTIKFPTMSSSEPLKVPQTGTHTSSLLQKIPVTRETSKILDQVRDVAAKTVPASADPAKFSKPSPTTLSSEVIAHESSVSRKAPSTPTTISRDPEKRTNTPESSQLPPAASKLPPKIPLAALNSEIVSNISSRAGARPSLGAPGKLQAGYKSAARKWTSAIVAMPILLVTSYVLYERLILGEEKKVLDRSGSTEAQSP